MTNKPLETIYDELSSEKRELILIILGAIVENKESPLSLSILRSFTGEEIMMTKCLLKEAINNELFPVQNNRRNGVLKDLEKALNFDVPTKVLPDGSTALVTEQAIVIARALDGAKQYIESLD